MNAEAGYLIKQESKLMSPAPFAPIKRERSRGQYRTERRPIARSWSGSVAVAASAQEFPPADQLVIGFGPAARHMAGGGLAQSTGQAVVIENMPGAGGSTAAPRLARAAPDGHTHASG